MNLYFLVEGDRTEALVYRHWVRHVFPGLEEVHALEELTGSHFLIVKGGGYPSCIQRIHDSLLDIKEHPEIDHFFICVDSEDMSLAERRDEVVGELASAEAETRVRDGNPHFKTHVIVQHCCIETWFLGHRFMMTRNPTSPELLRFQKFFDVRVEDPEAMGKLEGYVNKASFHLAYLKAMLLEKSPTLTYTKQRPGVVLKADYLDALRARCVDGDLASLDVLLSAWDAIAARPASAKSASE